VPLGFLVVVDVPDTLDHVTAVRVNVLPAEIGAALARLAARRMP
jgi:hypothetical protein